MKNFILAFLQCAEARKTSFWSFCSVQKHEFSSSGLDFSLSLILYPIRNSLPFTSLRPVTVGSGRDFLEGDIRRGQAHGLLETIYPAPVVAGGVAQDDATTVEDQVVRVAVGWDST